MPIVATVTLEIPPVSVQTVLPSDISMLASLIRNWVERRALEAGDSTTTPSAVINEGLTLETTRTATALVSDAQVVSTARTVVCQTGIQCSVLQVQMPGRRLTAILNNVSNTNNMSEVNNESQRARAISAYPPPLPPLSPPLASSAMENVTMDVRRARDAWTVMADDLVTVESALDALNVSLVRSSVTKLAVTVRLMHTAPNSSVAEDLAPRFDNALRNIDDLRLSLATSLPGIPPITTNSPQILYWHPIDGLVVFNATRPSSSVASGVDVAPLETIAPDNLQSGPSLNLLISEEALPTFSATVSGVVIVTIVASVVGSVAASMASTTAVSIASSSVSTTVGGAAGAGMVSAGASSAVAGVMPLLLGAQRFVSSAEGSAESDMLLNSVANSMSWTMGDFGIFTSSRDDPGRRLDNIDVAPPPPPDPRQPIDRLVNVMIIMAGTVALTLLLHALVLHHWKYRVNKLFYEVKRNPKVLLAKAKESSRRSTFSEASGGSVAAQEKKQSKRQRLQAALRALRTPRGSRYPPVDEQAEAPKASHDRVSARMPLSERKQIAAELSRVRFRPFPSPLVFPGIPLLAIQIFCSGITLTAAGVVADTSACDQFGCRAFAVGCLLFIAAYEALTIALVVNFHRHYRKQCWLKAKRPLEAEKVSDPLFRLISRIRSVFLPRGHKWRVIDRPRGAFKAPAEFKKEPARTERLLATPRTFVKSNPADTLDGIGFALMARSAGDSFASAMFEMTLLGANLIIATLNGSRRGVLPGSDADVAHVIAILCVQGAVVFYVVLFRPSADRVMNLLIMSQFSLEATGTALLLTQALRPDLIDAQASSVRFVVSVLAMVAPVLQRFYDAVIVQAFKLQRGGFTFKGAFFSMIGFIVFVPTMVLRLTACECDSAVAMSSMEMAGDDMNKLATKMANEGLVASIEEGMAELASRAFWQAQVDAEFRRENMEQFEELAARILQVRWRARLAARKARKRIQKVGHAVEAAAAWRALPGSPNERPGFAWLENQVVWDVVVSSVDEVEDAQADVPTQQQKDASRRRQATFLRSLPPRGEPASHRQRLTRHELVKKKWDPKSLSWV